MSESNAQTFCLYHSRLADLLQGVRDRIPAFLVLLARLCGVAPTVHLEPLAIQVGQRVVWGVLVTARRGADEILSAWVIADQAHRMASAERQRQGQARATDLCQRIEVVARARHLRVQPGWYDVPAQAFHQVASFEETPAITPQEAAHDGQ